MVSLTCVLKVDREGSIISYAMRQIRGRYLEEIDDHILFEGAMEGMIGRLESEFDDQHSAYIKPEKLQAFEDTINQQFGGVGMEVTMSPETKQLVVIAPMPGSPAEKAGILCGDKILKIDGESAQGLSLLDAINLMHGESGAAVLLSVLHEGQDEPVDIKIVRAVIKTDTVIGCKRNGNGTWDFFLDGKEKIGYVRITSFTENTAEEMRKAAKKLIDAGLRGLVIDLRGDPGGFLDQAVQVADMFIRSGVIVSTRGRYNQIFRVFTATEEGTLPDFPIAVLIDRDTASAGEIVAACLQDHGRAVVVGERSFGKGTIQELIELESKHGLLKLTTGTYWRPSEKDINRRKGDGENDDWGVRPDKGYEVSPPQVSAGGKDADKPEPGAKETKKWPHNDPCIRKALEYVRPAK